jgi:hypothetical protein
VFVSQRARLPTLLERAGVAAGAGICRAIIAAGSYTFLYGLASQLYGAVSSGAGGTAVVLFLLLVAIAMSVGSGALLSKFWE